MKQFIRLWRFQKSAFPIAKQYPVIAVCRLADNHRRYLLCRKRAHHRIAICRRNDHCALRSKFIRVNIKKFADFDRLLTNRDLFKIDLKSDACCFRKLPKSTKHTAL